MFVHAFVGEDIETPNDSTPSKHVPKLKKHNHHADLII